VLAPAVGDGLEQSHEAARRRQHHLLAHRVFEQPWIVLECGAQELIARNEQDDELGALFEMLPVPPRSELTHVSAHRARVTLERGTA
jgi:hypothetical protein